MGDAAEHPRPIRLILLPGLDGTGLLFGPLLHALSAEISITVIRYPGDQRLSYDELLGLVREQLPKDEPYLLLGESFSGPLAIRLAAESPPGLRGLILVATFVRKPVLWLPQWIGPWIPEFPFRLIPVWVQLRTLAAGKSSPEIRRLFKSALRQVSPRVLAFRVSAVLKVDVSETFRQITVPMLALAGRFDRTVPAHNLRLLQRLRSDIRVEMINSDHLVLQVEPDRAANIMIEFARSLCEA